jgi:hypothetical protein
MGSISLSSRRACKVIRAPIASTSPKMQGLNQQGSQNNLELVVACCALLAGLAQRLVIGWDVPLWIDEAYTGTIATQTTIHGLISWIQNELSGPVYYSFIFLWEKIAGSSDFALRLPSFFFSLAGPLSLLFFGHADRRTRYVWAALAAIWLPGFFLTSQARPYQLLFFLGCLQAIAFLRLVDQPTLRLACVWSLITSLFILTHLHAAVVSAFQGLSLLIVLRHHMRCLWPATLAFVPVIAVVLLQLPFVLNVTNPAHVWYNTLQGNFIVMFPKALLGPSPAAIIIVAIMVSTLARQVWLKRQGIAFGYRRSEVLLAISGLSASLVVFALAFLIPSWTHRYMTPFAPASLMAVVLMLRTVGRWQRAVPAFAIAILTAPVIMTTVRLGMHGGADGLFTLQFEDSSDWLIARGAKRVIFAWDNPASAQNRPEKLAEVGGFFFRRAHQNVEVEVAIVPPGRASSERLALIATAKNAAILWIGGTDYPDRINRFGTFDCRLFGAKNEFVSVACVPSR